MPRAEAVVHRPLYVGVSFLGEGLPRGDAPAVPWRERLVFVVGPLADVHRTTEQGDRWHRSTPTLDEPVNPASEVSASVASSPVARLASRASRHFARVDPDRQDLRLAGFAVVTVVALSLALQPGHNDGYAYWNAWHGNLYRVTWPEQGYVYSPAFAQFTWPLTQLPFEAFWALLVAVQAVALLLIAGPFVAALLMVVPWLPFGIWPNPVIGSLGNGNIMLLTAALTVYGLRYPGLWSVVLLTKITPGIGLLWFAVRREWRNLGIALGLTAGIAGVSFVVAPHLWFDWFGMLTHATSANGLSMETYLPLTLGQRLLVAVPLIVWGARTNRPWTVPIASMLALPAIALGGFCVGLGAIYWLHRDVSPQVQVGVRRTVLQRVDDGHVAR